MDWISRYYANESLHKFLLGSHSDTVPPDPIPNSEVKRISGDGSVGFPHVRVAHCQAPIRRKPLSIDKGFFYAWRKVVVSGKARK